MIDEDWERRIEDILLLAECKDFPSKVPKHIMNHARLMDVSLMSETHEKEGLFFSEVSPKDLQKPLNITIFDTGDGALATKFTRCKQVKNLKEIRGKCAIVSPFIFKMTICYFETKYQSWTSFDRFIAFRNGKYVNAERDAIGSTFSMESSPSSTSSRLPQLVKTAASIQFSDRYQWFFEVGMDQSFMLKVPIERVELKDIFKLRDLPPGRSRRPALRNWVSRHLRMKPSNPEEKTEVREHLRGAVDFSYDGLFFRVSPSEFDLEKNNLIKVG